MKMRKVKNARVRVDSRVDGGEWDRAEGYTAPGSLNPSKGCGLKGSTYRRGRNGTARNRSRKAVDSRT